MLSCIRKSSQTLQLGALALGILLITACGTAATATPARTAVPTSPPTAAATASPAADTPTPATATPIPTVAPTATLSSASLIPSRDSVNLVISSEPDHMNALRTGSSGISAVIHRDNLVDTLTWQSGDDLRLVPTSASVGWEQTAPDTWRFTLRQGVKFHDGEPWNAQAALPSATYQGSSAADSYSVPYTGAFTPRAVDDHTLEIKCAQACPIFPNTAFFLGFQSPKFYANATDDEKNLKTVGFGPYTQVEWNHGVSITEEAYADYVPAGEHFEFQPPQIKTLNWQWREETTVAAAMVRAGEADMAWDVGIDAKQTTNTKSGGSAEIFAYVINGLWHPELKKLKVRQAVAHAIDCKEIVDSLYGGQTRCYGNIIFPGVVGATEENTAPYPYDPELARRLLQEAGYNPENKITLLGYGARIPKLTEVHESVAAYLKAAGVNFEVRIMEPAARAAHSNCVSGVAVVDAMKAHGKDPKTDKPDRADFELAMRQGPTSGCTPPDIWDSYPSNETLDFGRQVNRYMNCTYVASSFCDYAEGGVQDQIAGVLAAGGSERQEKLTALANKFHDGVIHLGMFEVPVVYAINPKLNWEPRFDKRVRASSMWFSQ